MCINYCSSTAFKIAQLILLQTLQADVLSKHPQFDDLSSMASQVQGSDSRLVNLSTQLTTRYQAAKSSLRVRVKYLLISCFQVHVTSNTCITTKRSRLLDLVKENMYHLYL